MILASHRGNLPDTFATCGDSNSVTAWEFYLFVAFFALSNCDLRLMGVTGLWRLIEPSGKPVPLETLENKVLAIDVSIWLHQAIKGFQDAQGAPLPNAHLLGIYHRVCKLLYFRIKPIFVFDGGVPNLKKETISKRNQQKSKKLNEADRIQKQLLTTLLKHSAVNKVLSEKAKSLITKSNPKKDSEDIYKLPPTEFDSTLSSSDDETTSESIDSSSPTKHWDLHTIDEKSPHFKSLPADVRHEILTDLKETRKQSSWGRLHELPKQSDDFSSFQMTRLLKRNSVQVSLEEAEKEMGGRTLSLAELETLLQEQGVDTSTNSSVGSRIASDENTRYLLIKDLKKAMDEAKKQKELSEKLENIQEVIEEIDTTDQESVEKKLIQTEISNGKEEASTEIQEKILETKDEVRDTEFQKDLEKAIQLSLQDVASTSKQSTSTQPKNSSFLDFSDADFQNSSESEEDIDQKNNEKKLSSAKSYMLEYSGLTPNEIAKIISSSSDSVPNKKKNVNLNKLKPVSSTMIVKNISSTDETVTNTALVEENEVSSSTTSATRLKHSVASPSFDLNEVTSSTTALEINTGPGKEHAEDVEIISDDASSDASDFLEVSDKPVVSNQQPSGFEILIKPEDSLEDDIFSDIFSNKNESVGNTSDQNTEDHKLVVQVEPKVITDTKKVLLPHNKEQIMSEDTNSIKKVTFTENTIQSKEERTRNVVAEFVKPLQEAGKLNNSDIQSENKILTTEQLEVIEENLRQEKEELISGKLSKERMASSLTDQIYQEAQELLQLFGVPFIVAPMEAEAQCAFLDDINLTDGTITDDSDIWLFGGKTVYKNFFNQQKHVKEFRAENVQHHFKLTREQMILLALLVGSDYTVGIQGVGPVTALEILAAFPPSKLTEINLSHQQLISGLDEFRKWLIGERAVGPGRTTLRNKLKNVTLTDSFPSLQVVKAYLEPTIDSSKEPFSWAKADIAGLIQFARQKFGWTRVKSEEILKPVLKRLNESRIQRSIKDYFHTKHKIDSGETENKMSKRVKKAIDRIGREPNDNSDEEKNKRVKKQKPKNQPVVKSKKEEKLKEMIEDINDEGNSSDEDIQVLQKTRKQSKQKLEQIEEEVKNEIEQVIKKPRTTASLHKKDVIPQKEQDKVDALRSKIKAIEVFRKSKKGPGFLQKRKVVSRKLKEDAELSESSSD